MIPHSTKAFRTDRLFGTVRDHVELPRLESISAPVQLLFHIVNIVEPKRPAIKAMHNQESQLVVLDRVVQPKVEARKQRVLLLRAPYFTPWTPPLGLAILKSYLTQNEHSVSCFDFNGDPELWGMHHKYFSVLSAASLSTSNDGYSKLWWIINAHMLAYANGANTAAQRRVIETICPLYGVHANRNCVDALLPLVDHYFARLTRLFDQLNLSQYDVVGTSTYTTSLSSSLWLLRRAKERHPSIRTVMGGGVFADDLALGSENLQILLDEYPAIDHVVLGEGEVLLQKILDGTLEKQRVVSIADLKGATLDIKDVPTPDFSDFNLDRYYQLTIEGARSCPFQCSFCSETIQWGDYRKKPIGKFVEQILELKDRFKMREFFMGDSLMNPYLIPFADALIKQNADILYDGYLRADRPVTNQKFVAAWAKSGLYRVRLGIESASLRVLDSMDKKTTPAVISEALRTLARSGIRTTTYWIVGFPGETEEDFQETCEFIKDHYRYIYELEAHPYYYYPYGQVGSRLYQCESVYPEEVTNATKFKVWEIIGANPTREVRYERLDRISALAAKVGLPNIYTMSERYQAEDRWRSLHPSSAEVFANVSPLSESRGFERGVPMLAQTGYRDSPAVLCYRLSVSKKLELALLEEAMHAIIRNHEILRVKTAGTNYIPVSMESLGDLNLVTLFSSGADAGTSVDEIVSTLADEIDSTGPIPIRLGVRVVSDGTCELFFLAHRRFLDCKSVSLLVEDLCRVYEQLAEGRNPYFPPVVKSYADFAHDHSVKATGEDVPAGASAPTAFLNRTLSATNALAVSPSRGQEREATLRFVASVMRVLAYLGAPAAAVVLNPRVFDSSFGSTLGALNRLAPWPLLPKSVSASVGEEEDCGRTLEKLCAAPRPLAGEANGFIGTLIDLEFLVAPAWMGDDRWLAKGFSPGTVRPHGRGQVQIVPFCTPEGVVVRIVYRDEPPAKLLAHKIAGALDKEITALVRESVAISEAELFWREELGFLYHKGPALHSAAPHEAYEAVEVNLSMLSARFTFGEHTLDSRLVALSLYSLLVTRSDVATASVIMMLYPQLDKLFSAPVRLQQPGNHTCLDLMRTAERKVALAEPHGAYGDEVSRRSGIQGFTHHGCLFGQTRETRHNLDCLSDHSQPHLSHLHTILDLGAEGSMQARILYLPSIAAKHLTQDLARDLAFETKRFMENPELTIGDVLWTDAQRTALEQPASTHELAGEFDFSAVDPLLLPLHKE